MKLILAMFVSRMGEFNKDTIILSRYQISAALRLSVLSSRKGLDSLLGSKWQETKGSEGQKGRRELPNGHSELPLPSPFALY
jgi:hypothetical protein